MSHWMKLLIGNFGDLCIIVDNIAKRVQAGENVREYECKFWANAYDNALIQMIENGVI